MSARKVSSYLQQENDTQGQDLLELENFELPEAAQLQAQYTASATENPRSVQRSVSAPLPCAPAKEQPSAVSTSLTRDRCVSIKVGHFSNIHVILQFVL